MQKTRTENALSKYQPQEIEEKWRKKWTEEKLYRFELRKDKENYYNLVELPYPSGDLHLGHWFTFVNADAHARFMKMSGKNVFFPNGFDAFGLPAENAAIKRNIHPQDWTMKNIETMKGQFATMGTMIDWSHEAITCLPEYYRWNQWIFIKMFEKGIAYRGKTLSNWCPVDQTVLANEHVENGKCWRCGSVVEQKEVAQWFLKITALADELLWDNTDEGRKANGVDWPKSVREGQNNWIGRSGGAELGFKIKEAEQIIEVFTTRPDTLYGATFLVVAPEHPIVGMLISSRLKVKNANLDEVKEYVEKAKIKTEMERKEQKEKTGVFSGLYALHPLTKQEIPVWIADYVLWGYGTGAIMAVPAHDERDHAFAKKYNLRITKVIEQKEAVDVEENPYVGGGVIINSEEWNGLRVPEDIDKMIDLLSEKKLGRRRVEYHLHDWSVSRQRYWGTPVPMIHCKNCGIVPVPLDQLPVELPYEVDYAPKGKPPLATAEDWLNVKCPKCNGVAMREAETLDTFFDSSWYYYRYMDPHYDKLPFDPELAKELMPVDVYFGGAEHILGHTLYARFFTKFFKELGLITFSEFAKKRVQHGIILGPDGFRMSKSRGNVVNPDDVVKEYGTDAVRLYLAFMMPFEATAPWNPGAISGIYRFIRRVWELYSRVQITDGKENLGSEDLYWLSKTIKKVGEDLRDIKFNTAVSSLMEWLNYLSKKERISLEEYRSLLLLLAPLAPHVTEEIWQAIREGHGEDDGGVFKSIHSQDWPEYEEKYLVQDEVVIVVQVNGKVRANIAMQRVEAKEEKIVEERARESERVKSNLEGKTVKKVIYIQGKLLNFVTS